MSTSDQMIQSNLVPPMEKNSSQRFSNEFEFKTLLSVGGRNHNSTDWTRMVSTDANIDSFVQNSTSYIRKHNFDGIDIDWQFPAFCESEDR